MSSFFAVDAAVRALRAGGVIAYPTEGVYGLGCDPWDEEAVQRLLAIKQRPMDKGLLLIAASIDQLQPWLAVPEAVLEPLRRRWPDGTSYLIRAAARVPGWVRGEHATLGVRVTGHPLAAELCRRFGGPVVSTSANLSGRPAARNHLQVARQLGGHLDYLLAGPCGGRGRASTIIDLESGAVVRA